LTHRGIVAMRYNSLFLSAPARDLNMWSVFAAQSDAVPDFLNEEAYPDATEFDVQQAAAPSAVPKVKSAAAAAPTEKASCYHCYKMFFRETGLLDEPSNKQFCSNLCLEKCFASTKMMCASASCRRGFLRKDGILATRLDGSAAPALFCCAPCSRGLARPPSAPPAPSAVSTALLPVSRSLAGTPLFDADDDGSEIGSDENVDREVGSAHARAESPAAAAVLPPAEFTAAPIVEEPDD
jgi:hypothetical protein